MAKQVIFQLTCVLPVSHSRSGSRRAVPTRIGHQRRDAKRQDPEPGAAFRDNQEVTISLMVDNALPRFGDCRDPIVSPLNRFQE
jgi:hypothetical protein